jgi:hypothetical protein
MVAHEDACNFVGPPRPPKARAVLPAVGFMITEVGAVQKKKKRKKPPAKPVRETQEEVQRRKFGMGMIQSIAALKMVTSP